MFLIFIIYLHQVFFWELVKEETINFLNWKNIEGIIFPTVDSISGGNIVSLTHYDQNKIPDSTIKVIESQLKPTPGKEEEARKLFQLLDCKTKVIKDEDDLPIINQVHSLLLRPSIRKILGMSVGTPIKSICRWQMFPILRLANVVKIASTCRIFGIASAKINFGAAVLVGPAFASAFDKEWSDEVASYITCGRFNSNIGDYILESSKIFDVIFKFRHTLEGCSLRKEIFDSLSNEDGKDINMAINAGLKQTIPPEILQEARDKFVNLLISPLGTGQPTPIFWNDERYSEKAIK